MNHLLQALRSACFFALIFLSACGSRRAPVPPGVIPEQESLYSEDEKYGHEVLNNLTQQFTLDRDDARINRVRDLVDKLTKAAHADKNPWNTYILVDDKVKNAAATRGNYIFVWTGILRAVNNDAELSTILAHEIGHVLAGHTASDPAEETNRIISGIAGAAAGGLVGNQGLGGPVSDLAELIVRASLEALLVNPDSQAKEYEADQIGLFIMADAGINPEDAINFWSRIQNDPDFQSSPIEFLSSHPSTSDRLTKLNAQIGAANERYVAAVGGKPRPPLPSKKSDKNDYQLKSNPGGPAYWVVMEQSIEVFSEADRSSALKDTLNKGEKVKVVALHGRWLEIAEPVGGFVQSRFLAPED